MLLRLHDGTRGRVLLDGVDLLAMPRRAARSALAAVAQDPVLFAGSVAKNLDPFAEHDEPALRQARRRG